MPILINISVRNRLKELKTPRCIVGCVRPLEGLLIVRKIKALFVEKISLVIYRDHE
jgi:hypothetical protein